MSSSPFKVKAIYEYSSPHEDDLQFPVGQIITVTDEEDADWYGGEYVDDSGTKHEGIFPRNFVEKYEPTAPPRPTRTRTKKESEAAPPPASEISSEQPPFTARPLTAEPEEEEEDRTISPTRTGGAAPPALAPAPAVAPEAPPSKPAEPLSVSSPPSSVPKESRAPVVTSPPPGPKPAAAQPKPSGPPPVSEKPSSFKDRIAAFNKPAAPPVAPFKPSALGSGSSGFIKKPFVAPPPSRSAYVPPPRDVPVAKVYRRDEDPEIKEREAENLESAERAGLVPPDSQEGDAEDQPKPTSLKERIALLQKQQMEQAQRHAEAAAKKEKPKRPPKKRIESHGPMEAAEEPDTLQPPPLERRDTEETGGRASIEESHPPRVPHPQRRKSTKGSTEAKDGNEADMSGAGDTTEGQEDLTERDDSDEKSKHIVTAAKQDDPEEDEEEEVDEEDEVDVDPEVRRKEELRARMAKMSGGMGLHGIFGGGMMPMPGAAAPVPSKKKKTHAPEKRTSGDSEDVAPASMQAPPVPTMMALPGLSHMKRPEEKPGPQEEDDSGELDEEDVEDEDATPLRTPHQENVPPALLSKEPGAAPPVPGGRPAPPPIPIDSRPPPPPLATVRSPSAGSVSDDELSERNHQETLDTPRGEAPSATRAPPPLPPTAAPAPAVPTTPRSPAANRRSYISEEAPPGSPVGTAPPLPSKRNSRPPPPVPGSAPAAPPAQTRPPPPPPPGGLSRTSTRDSHISSPTKIPVRPEEEEEDEEDEEITEYEGDYDTDIASSVPHRDALRSHARESSFEDNNPVRSPVSEAPPSLPPPLPSGGAPRAVPPPVPSQLPPDNRRSADVPRAAPPPPPPPKEAPRYDDDDYDPFNYSAPLPAISGNQPPPPVVRPVEESHPHEPPYQPQDRRAPPPAPPSTRAPPRQSQDLQRSATTSRRSADVGRSSMESGYVANDIDLAPQSSWWLQPNSLPPQLQGRKDIFFESEESTSSKRGGKTTVTRDIYILFQDYSQTVVTVRFDPHDPADVHLEQRHEPPPRALRQDQLEESYERFGRAMGDAAAAKKDTVVGDGSPAALVAELLRPHLDALPPVGMRAYGALVYANLANASTAQNDEIRAGDVVSFRNARFQGKHGAMHAKYSADVGKPDHVAVVADWDGTKRKVRAWEQGRESKKVRLESFKLDDLRSGEVKVWRVMPRSWVGWEGQN